MILVIVPAALAELNAATAFYISSAGPNLGRMLVSDFERTANLILANPGIGARFAGRYGACHSEGSHTASFIRQRLVNCVFLRSRTSGDAPATGGIVRSVQPSAGPHAAEQHRAKPIRVRIAKTPSKLSTQ